LEVLMAYNYDPCNLREGGGIRYVHNLVHFLLKKNINLNIFCVELGKQENNKERLNIVNILSKSDSWWRFFINLMFKVPFIEITPSTIIHTHRSYFMLPFIFFCRDNPKVCTLHMKPIEFVKVEYPKYFNIINYFHKYVDSFCLDRIDKLLSISEDVKIAYENRYPQIKGKIRVVKGTGADIDKFKILNKDCIRKTYGLDPSDRIFFFAGRLEKIKNLDFLISSFKLIADERTKLIIAGNGTEKEKLNDLVGDLDLQSNVFFLGAVDPNKMPELYNCADITVLSSFSEASPNVLRESMACGTPFVSADVGDAKNLIISGVTGIIVESYDKKLFADSMIKMIEKVKKDPKLKEKCRKHIIQEFNFDEIGNEIYFVYNEFK